MPADGCVDVGLVSGGPRCFVAEDVRMAADQFAIQVVENVRDGESALVGRHLGIKEHLQKQIAKLFGKMVEVTALDGVEDLVDLFQRVFANGIEGLLAIPRAAAGSAQPSHDGRGLLKQCRCPRRIGGGLRRGILRAGALWRQIHPSPFYLLGSGGDDLRVLRSIRRSRILNLFNDSHPRNHSSPDFSGWPSAAS